MIRVKVVRPTYKNICINSATREVRLNCPHCNALITFTDHSEFRCKYCQGHLPAVDSLLRELDDTWNRQKWATIYYHRRGED